MARLNARAVEQQDQIEAIQLSHSSATRGYERNLDEFEKDSAKLQAEYHALKAGTAGDRGRALTAEKRLAQMEAELGGAMSAKNAAVDESAAEAEEAKRQLKELTAKRDRERRQEITVDKVTTATLQELQVASATVEKQLSDEKAEHARTRREGQMRASALESEVANYARLLATTQKSLDQRDVAYAAVEPAIRAAKQQARALEQQLAAAEKAKAAADGSTKQAQQALAESQQQAAELQADFAKAVENVSALKEQLGDAEESLIGLRSQGDDDPQSAANQLARLETRLRSMEDHLAGKQAEIARLTSERTAMKLKLDRAVAEQHRIQREAEVLQLSANSWSSKSADIESVGSRVTLVGGNAGAGDAAAAEPADWTSGRPGGGMRSRVGGTSSARYGYGQVADDQR